MDSTEALTLALIYPMLPHKIKNKVMIEILNACGYKFSLEDFEVETPATSMVAAIPKYIPKFFCRYCHKILKELKGEMGELTPEIEATLLDGHLDECPVFQVIEKHRK